MANLPRYPPVEKNGNRLTFDRELWPRACGLAVLDHPACILCPTLERRKECRAARGYRGTCSSFLTRTGRHLDIAGSRMGLCCYAESGIQCIRVARCHSFPAAETAAADGRSTRQHVGDAAPHPGVERRVDDWHCPPVDEHQHAVLRHGLNFSKRGV